MVSIQEQVIMQWPAYGTYNDAIKLGKVTEPCSDAATMLSIT